MDSVEASGKSIDDAILQALARLGRRRDEVDVAVLQEPSRGVRGVGAREARVRVWLKRAKPAPPPARGTGAVLTPDMAAHWLGDLDEEEAPPAPVAPPPQRVPSAFRPPQPPPMPVYADEDDEEAYADEEDAGPPTQPALRAVAPSAHALDETEEIEGAAVTDEVARQALDILRTILRHMGLPVAVEIAQTDPLTLNIRTNDEEMKGVFIGRRGETLAALQLIVNLMLNRKLHDRFHVIVDIEHYRQRRDENLRSLALRVAQQVQQTQRSMMLEPMTPYERRIVHLTLQDQPNVMTQSTGEGDQRRVVISLKRPGR
jgi:spoIIIJ-associated protein